MEDSRLLPPASSGPRHSRSQSSDRLQRREERRIVESSSQHPLRERDRRPDSDPGRHSSNCSLIGANGAESASAHAPSEPGHSHHQYEKTPSHSVIRSQPERHSHSHMHPSQLLTDLPPAHPRASTSQSHPGQAAEDERFQIPPDREAAFAEFKRIYEVSHVLVPGRRKDVSVVKRVRGVCI